MSKWSNFWGHLATINRHKRLVMKHCFKCGLIKQGLMHDLSKYTWEEFRIGILYFQGDKSPNGEERRLFGHSTAWLHHKGRNKHHLEYWVDYSTDKQVMGLIGCDMPKKYIAEVLCDRIAACKNYHGDRYTDADPYDYFMGNHKEQSIIHPKTREDLEMLLLMLRDKGEKETFAYVKNIYLKNK